MRLHITLKLDFVLTAVMNMGQKNVKYSMTVSTCLLVLFAVLKLNTMLKKLRPLSRRIKRPIFKRLMCLGWFFLCFLTDVYSQEITYVLDSISVHSKHTGLKIKDNIITYDISRDSMAANKSMMSLISSMPLVTYELLEDKLQINGSENIIILLNGRRSLIVNKSNFRYISEFLKGRDINSVSIDVSPTGIYSHYNAVININSRNYLSNFYSGSTSVSASSASSVSPSSSVTFAIGKLTANFAYGYERSRLKRTSNYTESHSANNNYTEPLYISRDTCHASRANIHGLQFNVSYDITPNDIVFFTSSGNLSNGKSIRNSFSQVGENLSILKNIFRNNVKSGNGSISYQHFFNKENEKVFTVQYSLDSKYSNNYYGWDSGYNRFSDRQHTFAVDYFYTTANLATWNANMTLFTRDYESRNADFDILSHKQNVLQTQLNASKRYKQFLFRAEAAFDYTSDRASFNNAASSFNDNYGTFRYNVRVNWFPRTGRNVMLYYGRTIYRPDINVRNPYRDESVAGVVTQGNPLLSNQKTNQLLVSYSYLRGVKYSTGITFSFINSSNGIFATTHILKDGRLLKSYENGIISNKLSIAINGMWRPSEKLTVNALCRIGWNKYGMSELSYSHIDYSALFNILWTCWKGGALTFNALLVNPSSQYTLPVQSSKIHHVIKGFVQISQRFHKSWIVGLTINEPWYYTQNIISEYVADGTYFYSKHKEPGMIIKATIRYNFGRSRSSVKKNSHQISDTDRKK